MMTFIIEFRLKPGSRNKIVEKFEEHGPNRHPGVDLISAWVGKSEDVIFAFVQCESEANLVNACKSWSETGDFTTHRVINIEQY
jgi:hypothetical protein